MMCSFYHTCAFTGHRPEKLPFGRDESDSRCLALKKEIQNQVLRLIDNGVHTFITGCAQGVDTWAGEIVFEIMGAPQYKANVNLYGFVPYEDQSSKWPEDEAQRWLELHQKCTKVHFIQRKYTPGCFYLRNRRMVEQSQWLLAVADRYSHLICGTRYTIEYARTLKRNIIYIHPETLQVSVE